MTGRVAHAIGLAFLLLGATALFAADMQYTIKEGETLFSVARKLQVPVDVLSRMNGIVDTGKVKAGTVLKVPNVYTVKKGDTLYGIARASSVTLASLLEANGLREDARLRVGQKLVIPATVTGVVAAGAAVFRIERAAGGYRGAHRGDSDFGAARGGKLRVAPARKAGARKRQAPRACILRRRRATWCIRRRQARSSGRRRSGDGARSSSSRKRTARSSPTAATGRFL